MNIILKLTNHLKMIKMGVFVFQYMAHNSRQWICFRIITLFILLFKNIFPTCKYVDRVACKDGLFSSREYIFHYKVIMSVRTQKIIFFANELSQPNIDKYDDRRTISYLNLQSTQHIYGLCILLVNLFKENKLLVIMK